MNKLRAVLRRRWPVLVGATLIGLIAGVSSAVVAGAGADKAFSSQQVLVASQEQNGPAFPPQDALKVTQGEVPTAAAKALHWKGEADVLAEKVEATADADSNSITVTATDQDPEQAVKIVDAFSTAFLKVVNADLTSDDQRQLAEAKTKVDQANQAIEAFDQEHPEISRTDIPLANSPAVTALIADRKRLADDLDQTRQQYEQTRQQLTRRQPYSTLGPEAPTAARSDFLKVPSSPAFRGILLGAVGLLLALVLVLVLERTSPRVDTREELDQLVSAPVIAEVPALPRKTGPPRGPAGDVVLTGPLAEHYRRVRSTIQYIQNRHSPPVVRPAGTANGNGDPSAGPASANGSADGSGDRVFLFTSAVPDEGKSTSSALTALALAEAGRETLIVDGDFRKPRLTDLLALPPSPNLDDLARAGVSAHNIQAAVQTCRVPHLWAAVGGPPTNVVFHRLVAAQQTIREAAERGGTVVVDSAPLRATNDTIDLLPVVDHVFLIVRSGVSTQAAVRDSVEVLNTYGASLVGIIFVGSHQVDAAQEYYDVKTPEVAGFAPAGGPPPYRPAPAPQPQR